MIASQAFNSVLLPATVACIFILGNKESVMGKYTHSTLTNIILIAIFLFSLVTSYMGIQGVLGLLS
jgi:Mn2+/Fe2+ NRAMP family transporter